MIIRMQVVLPAPLGPITPQTAPRGTARLTLFTATLAPKVLRTSFSSIACVMQTSSSVGGAYITRRGRRPRAVK